MKYTFDQNRAFLDLLPSVELAQCFEAFRYSILCGYARADHVWWERNIPRCFLERGRHVYVVSQNGKSLYVGKTCQSVAKRFKQHRSPKKKSPLIPYLGYSMLSSLTITVLKPSESYGLSYLEVGAYLSFAPLLPCGVPVIELVD